MGHQRRKNSACCRKDLTRFPTIRHLKKFLCDCKIFTVVIFLWGGNFMVSELSFVPKILLCGDEAEFLSRVGQRPFKIVGRVQLSGEVDGQQFNLFRDGKLLFDGKLQHINELFKMIQENPIDYFTTRYFRLVFVRRESSRSTNLKTCRANSFTTSTPNFNCCSN